MPSTHEQVQAATTARAIANALQQGLTAAQQGRITMGAGVVRNLDGTLRTLVGTSEPGGYIRPAIQSLLPEGSLVVGGRDHAEQNIVNAAKDNGQQVIAVGAGRPICPRCAQAIQNAGGIIASAVKGGCCP